MSEGAEEADILSLQQLHASRQLSRKDGQRWPIDEHTFRVTALRMLSLWYLSVVDGYSVLVLSQNLETQSRVLTPYLNFFG